MINTLKKIKNILKRNLKKFFKKQSIPVSAPVPEPEITATTETNEAIISPAPELIENAKFINSHEGEECFILGNGPSLKRVNLDKLKDKYVITCNMFTKVAGYEKVHSNIHVVIDDAFFQKRQEFSIEEKELMEIWKKICDMQIPVFVPLSAKEFITTNAIDKATEIYYLDILRFELPDRFGNELKVDISKPINSYTNVVQFSIVLALNMGFKKINLLGCDATGIYALLNTIIEQNKMEIHAYDNDSAKNQYAKIVTKNKLADSLYWESFNYLGFERLNELCITKNIQLYNLTDISLIDGIPKGDGKEYYNNLQGEI